MVHDFQEHPDEPLAYPIVAPYPGRPLGRRRTPVPNCVGHVYLPLGVLEATSRIMRQFGHERRECYAW